MDIYQLLYALMRIEVHVMDGQLSGSGYLNGRRRLLVGGLLSLLTVGVCVPLAYILGRRFWSTNPQVHVILELVCIFVAVGVFLAAWLSFDGNVAVPRLLGFGYLLVACFDGLHIYFYQPLGLFPPDGYDFSARFWLAGRMTEAVTFLLVVLGVTKLVRSRFGALTGAALIAGANSILLTSPIIPELTTPAIRTTTIKSALELVIVLLLSLTVFWQVRYHLRQNIMQSPYLVASVLLTVSSELCFVTYFSVGDVRFALGHLLKLASYCFLFQGAFVASFRHPYQRLLESECYHASLLNNLPVGLVTFDREKHINFANAVASNCLGANLGQFFGSTVAEVQARLGEAGVQVVLERPPDSGDISGVLTVGRLGRKRRFSFESHPLPDGGTCVLLLEANRETDLQRLRIQTRNVLDAISDSILLLDESGRVLSSNRAFQRRTGLQPKQLAASTLEEVMRCLQVRKLEGEGLPATGAPQQLEFTSMDGQRCVSLVRMSDVFNFDGELVGRILLGSDITDIRHNEGKLRQHEKLAALGQMAAGLVHEIRNPLTTIKGFNQMLMSRLADDRLLSFSHTVDSEISSINRIISDFLELSKPRQPKMLSVRINDLMQPLQLMLESHAFLSGVEFVLNSGPDELIVLVDKDQIQQVILNMVKNACEAMVETDRPQLAIEVTNGSGYAAISIRDNGPGISQENIAKLGTPFFTTKSRGTGLGLSMCYQIVDEHGGHIRVESELEKGTTFHIYLPRHATELAGSNSWIPES